MKDHEYSYNSSLFSFHNINDNDVHDDDNSYNKQFRNTIIKNIKTNSI